MPAPSLKKIILNTHLYGGLLCFSYLIIFGISSLNFNHPYAFTTSTNPPTTWQENVSIPDLAPVPPKAPPAIANPIKTKNNNAVRDALGLFGFNSPWRSHWINPETYRAILIRPGKTYDVEVRTKQNLAVVSETRANIFQVLHSLHGLAQMPASAFVATWGWYTELCVFVVVFAGASGIYLWTRRRNERHVGLIILATSLTFSLVFMLYITLHG